MNEPSALKVNDVRVGRAADEEAVIGWPSGSTSLASTPGGGHVQRAALGDHVRVVGDDRRTVAVGRRLTGRQRRRRGRAGLDERRNVPVGLPLTGKVLPVVVTVVQ